jgi:AraC-like DNA-binding protein
VGNLNEDATGQLGRLGLKRLPEHVIVGLLREQREPADPVQAAIDRDSFQRAAVELARKLGGALCGRLGDYGISLLVDEAGSGPKQRARLVDLCEKTTALARRFGLRLHSGVALRDDGRPWQEYQRALSAAEKALSQGVPIVHAERAQHVPFSSLAPLRKQLEKAVFEEPKSLRTRFEAFIEAAELHSGFVVDVARAHLEAGYDQVCEAYAEVGVRDEKGFRELRASVRRDTLNANTIAELSASFRRGIADIALLLEAPSVAHREQGMRRAVTYIRDHLGEPLSIQKVAKVAGFAPRHFTELFHASVGETFARFVSKLRIERAKTLLFSTNLSAERVGELAGFGTRGHFYRAFKESLGVTPAEYRAQRDT